MIFDSLDKLRRGSLMNAIFLIAIGTMIIICPRQYIEFMSLALGYVMIVISIVMMLNYFTGKKTIMDHLMLMLALVVGIVGLCVLMFRADVIKTVAWLFSFFLLLDGIRNLYYSVTYARVSGRKGWWFLSILAALLVAIAVLMFRNPWWNTPDLLMKAVGGAVLFSAAISAMRIVFTRPIGSTVGGDEDGKE